MRVLFILFALLPILEIALLINVGSVIGGWNTVGIVILTAFLGAYFVKREGIHTLQIAQQKMQRNEVPGKELVEGLMLVVAGILLVTPGFITDIVGFMFALPGTRHLLANQVSKHMKMRVVMPGSSSHFDQSGFRQSGQSPFHRSGDNDDVLEGEYSDNTQNNPDKRLK